VEARAIRVTEAQPRPNGWWGMLLLIATEATLFLVLIATYFYLRFRTVPWPPDGVPDPKVLRPLAYTFVLVLSTVPMLVASSAARAGRHGLLASNLLAAVLLAGVYLWLQSNLLRDDSLHFTPRDNAYGSIYFTLQVAHAAHVFAGILLNVWLIFGVARRITLYRLVGVEAAALYWYFVNALAVAIVLVVISPSL
jgi:heme/copper-type cytochrome/quinol oxidase subunit 3